MKVEVSRRSKTTYMLFRRRGEGERMSPSNSQCSGPLKVGGHTMSHLFWDIVGGHFCCGTFLSMRWLFPRRLEKVGSLCKSELLQGNFNKEPKESGCSNTIIKIKDQEIYTKF